MKKLYLSGVLTLLLFSFKSFATTYTFTGSGEYANAANWQEGKRPPYINFNTDTILISGSCTLTIDFSQIKYNNHGLIWVKSGGIFTLEGFNYHFYNTNQGELRIEGTVNNNVSFSQEGTLDVYGTLINTLNFTVLHNMTLRRGSTFENAGFLTFFPMPSFGFLGQIVCEEGSQVINTGNVYGTVQFTGVTGFANSGILAPGNSPGTAAINGDYSATSTAVHNFEVAGNGSDSYDNLVATGKIALDGTLNVLLIDGYTPQPGDNILLFTGGVITGSFVTVNKPLQYQLVYNTNSVVLRYLSVLPVTFTNLDVKQVGSAAKLGWTIQNEFNVVRYEVEKSSNGKDFRKLAKCRLSFRGCMVLQMRYRKTKPFTE